MSVGLNKHVGGKCKKRNVGWIFLFFKVRREKILKNNKSATLIFVGTLKVR